MTAPDLDALEKLAARIWSAVNDHRYPRFSDMESSAEALDALIAELKEARGLLKPFARRADYWEQINGEDGSDRAETNHAIGDFKKARNFLARNGSGQ